MTQSNASKTFSYSELDDDAKEVARQAFGININRHIDFRDKTISTIVKILASNGLVTTHDAISTALTPQFTFQYQTPKEAISIRHYLLISFNEVFSEINGITNLAKSRLGANVSLSIIKEENTDTKYAFFDGETTYSLYQCEIDALDRVLTKLYLDIEDILRMTCPDCLFRDELQAIAHFRFLKNGHPHF